MIVLDTNVLNHFLRGDDVLTRRILDCGERVAITIVTKIEVLQGHFDRVLKADTQDRFLHAQARLVDAEQDLALFDIAYLDARAIDIFFQLKKEKGAKKIGRADLLIAASVVSQHALLVTRNLRDFRLFKSLRAEDWTK
ncbi:MAG: PIN domain-containing protein [Gemmataceae bacterium]